ncbi:MAG: hypothetical protein COV07_04385 [Candidatus Vogelbacteria bacterium CG10_big_fil_rev_8_21_14_0_10_45_14]|uniref:SIMPL domain-containing protein n=1 Tax=Candidatus Vogelbacteria bacterium CG10_big_fil_rev_8_21_14_0_10_45_14 TaxID=1975042 RepID=A0A2H0RIR4_9BACT|nr:MAG: hypothetical protein COV07_04385 [Candidatus Vogelbacteria bacterium CG10_big_fil_rev_8_21_14_0_10_45_14]
MSERIKNYLGIAIIIGVLSTGFSAMSLARGYGASIEPGSYRSFSVSGEGKITTIPDVARTSAGILVEGGKDLGALQESASKKSRDLVAFLKKEGVDAKDIKTEQYSVEPRYQYFSCGVRVYSDGGDVKPCPPPEIVGYTIRQSVSIKIRDFEKIGAIMAGVVDNGANTISGISFTVDEPAIVEAEARAEAIEMAKEKAEAVSKAGGFSLGKLLAIEEGGSMPIYRTYAMPESMDMAMGVSSQKSAPAIEAGSQDVTVNVILRYEIK